MFHVKQLIKLITKIYQRIQANGSHLSSI